MFLTDMPLEELRDRDKEFKDEALVSLASYGPPSEPLYAAIWLPSLKRGAERPRVFFAPAEPAPTQAILDTRLGFEPGRYSPVAVTATGDVRAGGESGVRVTWVLEEYHPPLPQSGTIARVASSITRLVDGPTVNGSNPQNTDRKRCVSLDAVWFYPPGVSRTAKNQDVAYLGVFKPNPGAIFGIVQSPEGEYAPDNATGVMYAPFSIEARRSYKRIHTAIPAPMSTAGARRIVYHMRGDAYEAWPASDDIDFWGGTVTDGPLRRNQLNYYAELRSPLIPIQVSANGIGTHLRFCVTWAPSQRPKARYFRVVDGAVAGQARVSPPTHGDTGLSRSLEQFQGPGPVLQQSPHADRLLELRDELETRMLQRNISNAQLAIAVDGKLKLLWSLTLGEQGWRMSQPTMKFRFGSCAKLLTAMRAVSLGEGFLKSTLVSALGDIPRPPGLTNTEWNRFSTITIEQCLWHLSGLTTADLFDDCWTFGRQSLPLKEGDVSLDFMGGGLPGRQLYYPGVVEDYNNFVYSLVGEAISYAVSGLRTDFLSNLTTWLTNDDGQIEQIPGTRGNSISAGEPPMRSRVCAARNTSTSSSLRSALTAAGQLPPYVAGGYDLRDFGVWNPAGALIMSAATLARILQILHPAESSTSSLPGRMTAAQLTRLQSRSPDNVVPALPGGAPSNMIAAPIWSLGCQTEPLLLVSGGQPSLTGSELRWGGNLGTGQSCFNHFVIGSNPATARSMSVAFVTNSKDQLGIYTSSKSRTKALDIFSDGGWDNNEDLFPDLGLA